MPRNPSELRGATGRRLGPTIGLEPRTTGTQRSFSWPRAELLEVRGRVTGCIPNEGRRSCATLPGGAKAIAADLTAGTARAGTASTVRRAPQPRNPRPTPKRRREPSAVRPQAQCASEGSCPLPRPESRPVPWSSIVRGNCPGPQLEVPWIRLIWPSRKWNPVPSPVKTAQSVLSMPPGTERWLDRYRSRLLFRLYVPPGSV